MKKFMCSIMVALLLATTMIANVNAANIYEGSISSSYLQYAKDTLAKVSLKDNYVFFRSGQYSYDLVVGDIEYKSNKFSSDECFVYSFSQTSNNYNNAPTVFCDTFVNWSLDPNGVLVYSDLGHYPTLEERGDSIEILQSFVLIVIGLCIFIRGIFFRR